MSTLPCLDASATPARDTFVRTSLREEPILLTRFATVVILYMSELEGWLGELGLEEKAKEVAEWKAEYQRQTPPRGPPE